MRSQRWIVLIAVVMAILAGIAIAGLPHRQQDLDLKPLPPTTTSTTSVPGGPSIPPDAAVTTTVP